MQSRTEEQYRRAGLQTAAFSLLHFDVKETSSAQRNLWQIKIPGMFVIRLFHKENVTNLVGISMF